MEKIPKKTNITPKIKKRKPLKVVYITNPIKFETSALDFRALVQELTGRDAEVSYSVGACFSEGAGGGAAVKAADEDNAHAVSEEEEVTKSRQCSDEMDGQEESDPTATAVGSDGDDFASSLMTEGLGLDMFEFLKNLDAM